MANSILFLIFSGMLAYSDWNTEIVEKFLLPLTYPQSEWSASDFGQPTTNSDIDLLKKFQPEVYIAEGSPLPIDFYKTYLANSVVCDEDRNIVIQKPNRDILKSIERQSGLNLDYRGTIKNMPVGPAKLNYSSPIYGRVFNELLTGSRPVSVLKYNLVFPISGLPKGLSWFQSLASHIAGDIDNWHELDIHGAIHLIIDKNSHTPLIILLAQHNHFATFVVGKDVDWPINGRLKICFSIRSNEPYLCTSSAKPDRHRTIGDPSKYKYILTGEGGFWMGSEDIVMGPNSGARKLTTHLATLPTRDPLYVSWIPLGERQKILGVFPSFFRNGPPGINMNTWPELKDYSDIAKFWYFQKGDKKVIELLDSNFTDFFEANLGPIKAHNGRKLIDAINAIN